MYPTIVLNVISGNPNLNTNGLKVILVINFEYLVWKLTVRCLIVFGINSVITCTFKSNMLKVLLRSKMYML